MARHSPVTLLYLSIARTFRFKESFLLLLLLFAFSSYEVTLFQTFPDLNALSRKRRKIYRLADGMCGFETKSGRSFAYLYVIRVEFGARQAVERAEVQATREDSVRTAALPATKIPMLVRSNPLQNSEIRRRLSTLLIRKYARWDIFSTTLKNYRGHSEHRGFKLAPSITSPTLQLKTLITIFV